MAGTLCRVTGALCILAGTLRRVVGTLHRMAIHGISVSPYTILEIFFTPPLFPKITKCPSKAKNYRTTKKKVLRGFTPPLKFFFTPTPKQNILSQKKFTPPPKILHHPGWHGWLLIPCLDPNMNYFLLGLF